MHSVERSPEPEFLSQMGTDHVTWDKLDGGDRRRIRDALVQDFGPICAYCETQCEWPNRYRQSPLQETIDHFRPRQHFPGLWLDWLNLVYACHRCNQAKGNSWPGFDDQSIDMWLVAESPRFTPISEYVTPNAEAGRRTAQEHFEFSVETGEIRVAEQLGDEEWSMARRTIRDVDLNDSRRGENDPGHLLNRRRRQRRLLEQRLSSLSNPIQMVEVAIEFTQPGTPFSSYVAAFFADRFGPLS